MQNSISFRFLNHVLHLTHLGLKSEKLVVLRDALLPPPLLPPDAFLDRLWVIADADNDTLRYCVDAAAVSFLANFFSRARVSTTGRNFLTSPGNKIEIFLNGPTPASY